VKFVPFAQRGAQASVNSLGVRERVVVDSSRALARAWLARAACASEYWLAKMLIATDQEKRTLAR